jgi:hypothetical protein
MLCRLIIIPMHNRQIRNVLSLGRGTVRFKHPVTSREGTYRQRMNSICDTMKQGDTTSLEPWAEQSTFSVAITTSLVDLRSI